MTRLTPKKLKEIRHRSASDDPFADNTSQEEVLLLCDELEAAWKVIAAARAWQVDSSPQGTLNLGRALREYIDRALNQGEP